MFPNGNTAIDDRVMASAFTASETTSSRWDNSVAIETACRNVARRRRVVRTSQMHRCRRRSDGLDIADKAEATPVQCPDEKLIGAVVAKHAPGAIDAAGERGFGDGPAIPDGVDQFILADNPIMVADQMNDEIEDLRLDMDGHALAAQLVLAEVELEIGKTVFHYHLYDANEAPQPEGSPISEQKQPLAEEKQTSPEEVRQA